MDCLFVNPDSSLKAYQGLSGKYSAIEPPTWALLLAESCRSKGFEVGILDCCAESLSLESSIKRVNAISPRVVLFVVYGQNPNAGTTSMIGATLLAEELKKSNSDLFIGVVGSHASALPQEVLALPYIDFVLLNEGVYSLHNLLLT
jgi:anaerobic magnesium-protoporphyrin IX monomethyl ester cyclase